MMNTLVALPPSPDLNSHCIYLSFNSYKVSIPFNYIAMLGIWISFDIYNQNLSTYFRSIRTLFLLYMIMSI